MFFYKYYFIKDIMVSVNGTDSGSAAKCCKKLTTVFSQIQDEYETPARLRQTGSL